MSSHYIVHSDGGARGNPGPAGIGVVIERKSDGKIEKVGEISEFIGQATNNQAEYRALIAALEEVDRRGGKGSTIECVLDSELIVEQVSGNFRVKNLALKPLYARVRELVIKLGGDITFRAVPRSENGPADKLVNAAINRFSKNG